MKILWIALALNERRETRGFFGFVNCEISEERRTEARSECSARQHLRKSAASLHILWSLFPRRKCRGPIEVVNLQVVIPNSPPFPRRKCRCPIEVWFSYEDSRTNQ